MIVSSEVQGAIIVQDAVHEHRFDMDDLRLLTTLAAQVAITIRNIHLFQEARERADRETNERRDQRSNLVIPRY